MKVRVEISARHIHLSQKDMEVLYGQGYGLKKHIKKLSQPGQFAEEEVLQIIGPKNTLKARVLGPVRPQTQVEISLSDCYFLGIDAPIRLSGKLKGSAACKLVGPKGELNLKEGVIVAKRHLHLSEKEAAKMQIKQGQNVKIEFRGSRALLFDKIEARLDKNYRCSVHLDTDEANAAGIKKESRGELLID